MPQINPLELSVATGQNNKYPIFVDSDDLSLLEDKYFQYTKSEKALVIISEKVYKLYKNKLNFKKSIIYRLKDGESQKNFENYKKLLAFASKNRLERKDTIIAIGGGVVGDLAGFVAATYMRGINLIQIPTTLLACVDSSVGGKVAINSDFGKNLVGTFYQPKAVFLNLNFLTTLDERQFKTGLCEVLKYAFIEKSALTDENYDFLKFLDENFENIIKKDFNVICKLIQICLNIKISVVSKDEKELGLRKILNFGHTLAHAIEKTTNYKKYTHGEAVALGMIFAFQISFSKNLIEEGYFNQSVSLIKKYQLLKSFPKLNSKIILNSMTFDKKNENGRIQFILPTSKATVESFKDITDEEILSNLKKLMPEYSASE